MKLKNRVSLTSNVLNHFLTTYSQDDVFNRLNVDVKSPESIISTGSYYHKHCLRAYEKRYQRRKKNVNTEEMPSFFTVESENHPNIEEKDAINYEPMLYEREAAIFEYIKFIEFRIYAGEAFELSTITDAIR